MKRTLLPALAFVLLAAACTKVPLDTAAPYRPPTVPADDAVLLDRHGIDPPALGYLVLDADTGEVVAARQENRAFIPASTTKVLTTLASLGLLGPDFRFETLVATDAGGLGDDGTLDGDLYLVGGGDPLLTAADLMALADQLHAGGVERITGRFFYDETLFAAAREIASDQPDDATYNPGVSALSLDFNLRRLAWRRKVPGTLEVYTTPPVGDEPGMASHPAPAWRTAVRDPLRPDRWLMAPNMPYGSRASGETRLPLADPGLHTAQVFRALAGLAGLELPGPEPGMASPYLRILAQMKSEPLVEVVRAGLEHSNNLVAELTGLMTARAALGRRIGIGEAASFFETVYPRAVPEVDWSGLRLPNLSGLSAKARVSPVQMASVLRFADRQYFDGWRYMILLPASGWRESFGGRFDTPDTAMRVWAKTGTMKYASGLAGYLYASSGRRLTFALYVTDFGRRTAYDARPDQRLPGIERTADAWTGRAEALQRDLVARWIADY